MKKSYFITWIGAISTMLITAFSVSHKVKKYGRKIHSDRLIKLSDDSTSELIDKGMDLALKKLIK